MKFTLALMGLAGLAAAAPQGVTSAIAPSATAPAGCKSSYTGQFEITIVKPSNMKRSLEQRESTCGQEGILTLGLENGMLTDNLGRTGYIAGDNQQFQFDKPVQAGAEFTSGFSVCGNGSIALGGSTTFYQCQSGGFYNLYYQNVAAQCSPVNIDIIPCSSSSSASGSATAVASGSASGSAQPVSVSSDGQAQATAPATTAAIPVSVASEGQPQATVAATSMAPVAVSEYTDGQPQATAAATAKSNATVAATASPSVTIATAGAASFGVSASLLAGVFGLAAYFL